MEDIELWMPVGVFKGVDFTGYYEISTFGNARSLDRWIVGKGGSKRLLKGKRKSPIKDIEGYLYFRFSKNGITKNVRVHQAVLQTFNPNPNPKIYTQINHIDENKENNRLDNLEWCTAKDNINYGQHNKRVSETKRKRIGKRVVQLDNDCNFVKEWGCVAEIADKTNYSRTGIQNCLSGAAITCGGYKWIYSDVYNELTADELFKKLNKPKLNTKWRPIVQLNLNYKLVKKWNSITDATKNGYKKNRIWDCLNNKRNKYYGYRWMYLEDYEKLDNKS